MRKRGLCRRKMAGWMDAHHAGIVSTAKPIYILKLFRPSGSPIILVSSDPCAGTKFQGNPFSGALNTQGGINWRFSTKINVYLGNGTTQAHGYYGTLAGSRGCVGSVCVGSGNLE